MVIELPLALSVGYLAVGLLFGVWLGVVGYRDVKSGAVSPAAGMILPVLVVLLVVFWPVLLAAMIVTVIKEAIGFRTGRYLRLGSTDTEQARYDEYWAKRRKNL